MTQYIFDTPYSPEVTQSLLSGIADFQDVGFSGGRKTITTFNHNNQQQIDNFCDTLAQAGITTVAIDGVQTNIIQKFKFLRTDQLIISMTPRLQITNLPSTYTDVFPALYQGNPIAYHNVGYTKAGFTLLWNKNAGTGQHDLRLVKCDIDGNPVGSPDILVEGLNLANGRTRTFDFQIPASFLNFRGFVKLQAKSSVTTDDPILDALWIYNVR